MKKEINIDLSPNELAELFIPWDDYKQAEFINLIGEHFKSADFNDELQCCYMAEQINEFGKGFIYTLANFVKVQKLTNGSYHFNRLIDSY